MVKKAGWLLVLALASVLPAFSASSFLEKGEALFIQNQPKDAAPLLESALSDDPSNEKIYLYLGIIYQQLGDLDKALAILKRGTAVAATYKDLMFYNIGNDLFARKEFSLADQAYSEALGANKELASGYLNRGNARLQLQNWDGVVSDYLIFLQLRPQDPQRPKIEEIIRLIRGMQDAKQKQLADEAARQKALMNDVMNSLTNAGDDTKNLSVESIKGKNDPVDVDIKD